MITSLAVAGLLGISSMTPGAYTQWVYHGDVFASAYAGYVDSHFVRFESVYDYADWGPGHLTASAYSSDPVYNTWCSSGADADIMIRRGRILISSDASATGTASAQAGLGMDLSFISDSGDSGTVAGTLGSGGILTITGDDGFSRSYAGTFSEAFYTVPGVQYALHASYSASTGTTNSMMLDISIPTPGSAALGGMGVLAMLRRRRA